MFKKVVGVRIEIQKFLKTKHFFLIMRLWGLILLIILAGCTSETVMQEAPANDTISDISEATIHCSYMRSFNISENATDDELTETARKNVINPVGLDYDYVNQFRYLNCTSTDIVCAHKSMLDCWWKDGEFVELDCGPFPNGTITAKKNSSGKTILRKVMNNLFDSGFYEYLSNITTPGCALNQTCEAFSFECISEDIVYTCERLAKGGFECE